VLAAAIAFFGNVAYAQTTDEEESDSDEVTEETVTEEITVTGSRIARDEFSSISPLQVIDGEVARDLGLVDTADLLRQTTVVQGQQFTTGLTTSAGLLTDSGPGSATASLRGLDAGRTLVLVNGRRLAPAGVGGAPSAPDLNLVPGTLIERVDVLLDGASSVYGSDAVAGVVNVILRSDFDGLQLDAYQRMTDLPNDGGNQSVFTATWGVNNDRGFMGFAVESSNTDGYKDGDLGDFYEPYSQIGDNDCRKGYYQGASGTIYPWCSGSFGVGAVSGSPAGFLGFDGTTQLPGYPPGFFQIPITADLLTPGSAGGAALLLWPEEFGAAFSPDFKRNTLFSVGEYSPGWYGDATVYYEASYSSRESTTNSASQGRVRVPGDYALGNFGGRTSTLYYRWNRVRETEVAQTRFTAGIKGDLPFMDVGSLAGWTYDAYANYSRSSGQDRINGIQHYPRLEQTLSNTRFDAATGEFVCDPRTVDGEAKTVDCRPLNFFEPSFILTGRFSDPADNDYLFPNRMTNTVVEQTTLQAYITGELFGIPTGGPAGLVLGFEYRDDRIRTDTDAGTAGGDFFRFSADPGSTGTRWLREVFAEIDLPLVEDRRFVNELSLNVAARITREEFFGEETTYRIQGQYAPVDWLRAVPLIDHDNDPSTDTRRFYNPDLDTRDQTVLDNCRNGGGPFNIPGTNPEALGTRGLTTETTVFFGAPTLVASGSNPDLKAETSTAETVGIVFEQPWTDKFDLRLSATYFDIEIDDEVDELTASTIVNRCYNSPGLVDQTCGFITRDPRDDAEATSGEISFVNAIQQNLGQQIARGVDYNLDFGTDITIANREIYYNLIARATESRTQTEEEFRADEIFLDDDLREFGNPEWRLNLTNIIEYKDWAFLWQSRYISDQIEDNDDPEDTTTSFFSPCAQAGDTPCVSYDDLNSYVVHDFSVAWRNDQYVVRFGVNNVFDDAPPLTNNNDLGSLGGIGYDLRGRTLFLNFSAGL
jgi:iron complex outermembrane receptor protein